MTPEGGARLPLVWYVVHVSYNAVDAAPWQEHTVPGQAGYDVSRPLSYINMLGA